MIRSVSRLTPLLIAVCCLPSTRGADPAIASDDLPGLRSAYEQQRYDEVIAATAAGSEALERSDPRFILRVRALQNRGVAKFFTGKMEASIADFDAFVAMIPEEDPHHWQRGLAYYYAEQYEKGKAQFERHQTVNSQDVENAVWHFLCAVKRPGGSVEAAREDFIAITGDPRVPMAEVHALFAGTGSAEEILEAASQQPEGLGERGLRNQLCYAHLYLALYYEAIGDQAKSNAHILAAATDHRMDHYMGRVAQLHARLRGALPEPAAEAPLP